MLNNWYVNLILQLILFFINLRSVLDDLSRELVVDGIKLNFEHIHCGKDFVNIT